jgi:predicted transcriptional regulator
MHFIVSQISKRLDVSRTTVDRYLDMSPDEMDRSVLKTRVGIRDMAVYIEELRGANQCRENLNS